MQPESPLHSYYKAAEAHVLAEAKRAENLCRNIDTLIGIASEGMVVTAAELSFASGDPRLSKIITIYQLNGLSLTNPYDTYTVGDMPELGDASGVTLSSRVGVLARTKKSTTPIEHDILKIVLTSDGMDYDSDAEGVYIMRSRIDNRVDMFVVRGVAQANIDNGAAPYSVAEATELERMAIIDELQMAVSKLSSQTD